ncbi:hypothetical protein WMY93_025430 [Mugilogobius chulae]|uniref:Uncharacterized protein n=1 Tax=Mugilogobius chulae TaxID=88201 RepID=A0AAW0N2H5_9GOBI
MPNCAAILLNNVGILAAISKLLHYYEQSAALQQPGTPGQTWRRSILQGSREQTLLTRQVFLSTFLPREAAHSSKNGGREVPRVEHRESDSKCTHICSRRGIILICAVLTNALVLICLVAAHMVTSGMSAATASGGFNINSNFNLQGTELQKVRDLDMQYSQMRAPAIYGGIPFSLTCGIISLLFVVAGNKPPHLMARKLLVGALIFQAVGSVAYIVAVGLLLHFIIGVNATDVCQQRERIMLEVGTPG